MNILEKKLIPMKAFYFCQMGVVSVLIIYITNYFQMIGLTYTEISITGFVAAWTGFFSRTLVGGLADKLQKFKETLIFCSLASMLVFSLMLTIPAKPIPLYSTITMKVNNENSDYSHSRYNWSAHLCVHNSSLTSSLTNDTVQPVVWPSRLEQCYIRHKWHSSSIAHVKSVLLDNDAISERISFSPRCRNAVVTVASLPVNHSLLLASEWMCEHLVDSNGSKQTVFREMELGCDNGRSSALALSGGMGFMVHLSATFLLALTLRSLGYFFYSPNLSLADAVTFSMLGQSGRHRYGHTRLFGSLGFLVFAILSAVAMELGGVHRFSILFIAHGVILVMACAAAYALRLDNVEIRCTSHWKSFGLLFHNWEVFVFFLFTLAGGMCMSIIENYLFPSMCDLLQPPTFIYGLMSAMMVTSETPVLAISGRFIRQLGEPLCMSLSFFIWSLRFIGYSCVTNYWVLLLIEPLHGLAFGLFLPAMTTYASRIAPEGMEGILQGLTSGVYFGAGISIGSLLVGPLFDHLDKRNVFRICALFSFGCSILYTLFTLCRIKSRYQRSSSKHKPPITENDNKDISSLDDAEKPLKTNQL